MTETNRRADASRRKAPTPILKRIVSSSFANATGIGISAISQLISVPVLTSAWGIERYGTWLVLTTIPVYLALSDMGFASAATSDMTMHAARGHHEKVTCTFQSVWLLVNAMAALPIALTGLLVKVIPFAPWESWESLAMLTREHGRTLLLLVCYSAVAMNARIILSAFRATENYALGTILYDCMTLVETSILLSVAFAGLGFESCVCVLLGTRTATFAMMWFILRRQVPWLALGVRHASLSELKRLWRPAIAALSIPAALAVNLQGMIVVAGVFISPAAAGILAPVRTISRIAVQIVGIVNRATIPELSAAGAKQDRLALANIIVLNIASVIFVLAPGATLFAIFGGRVIELWTNFKIHPDPALVVLVAIASIAHGLWSYTSNILLAFNEHTRIARSLILLSLTSVLLAVPLAKFSGLTGIGVALAGTEIVCVIVTLRASSGLRLLNWENLRSALRLRIRSM